MEEARRVQLAYGRTGLEVEVPPTADVIEPRHLDGLSDEAGALRVALRRPLASPPLRELVPRGATVAVSICDVTRPFPARRVLPVLVDELDLAGAGEITLLVATGTHRACRPEELAEMLGPELPTRVRVVQHNALDASAHADLGTVPGSRVPARIQRSFLGHAVRITTGFVEPHFFAGFSGGPKMVAPGLAQLETVLELHSADRIKHPQARWGVTEGNPVHDPIREIAARAGVTFNLDLTLNRDRAVTGVFAGGLPASHAAACAFALRTAMVRVRAPYDLVVTTNSGYPLDQNLYQTIKGISAASQVVRDGGTILAASECSDGLPDHGRYRDLLRRWPGPAAFLAALGGREPVQDQWQVQVQASIQVRARVLLHSRLDPEAVRAAWMEPVSDLPDTIRRLARGARVAVLPEGPQTIPYLT